MATREDGLIVCDLGPCKVDRRTGIPTDALAVADIRLNTVSPAPGRWAHVCRSHLSTYAIRDSKNRIVWKVGYATHIEQTPPKED